MGKDAFNCQVVLFNKEETLDYNSDDMKITVDIGCMKIIYLNWFVTGVLVRVVCPSTFNPNISISSFTCSTS